MRRPRSRSGWGRSGRNRQAANRPAFASPQRKELVMAINTGRAVAGDLVAGVVANPLHFLNNTYVLGADMPPWGASHNIGPPTLTSGALAATRAGAYFIYGLPIVFTS